MEAQLIERSDIHSDADSSLPKTRVLLVDDSNTVRQSLKQLLEASDCEISTAEDGFEALLHCAISKPDIVLMDITMPQLDGFDVCSLLRANKQFADTPIILVSANDNPFDRAKAQLLGAQAFVAKPFAERDILEALRQQLPGRFESV
ncbi:MAG: response regulator [Pseudohongiellaceae bacterium]|nr:response regulator [Pseudohongiellaceae bacterium]